MRSTCVLLVLAVMTILPPAAQAGVFCIQNDGNLGHDAPDDRAAALFLQPGAYPENCVGMDYFQDPRDWYRLQVPADRQAWVDLWSGSAPTTAQTGLTLDISGQAPASFTRIARVTFPLQPGSVVHMLFEIRAGFNLANYSIYYTQVAQPVWGTHITSNSTTPGVHHVKVEVNNTGVAAGDATLRIETWNGDKKSSCFTPIHVEPGGRVEKLVHIAAPQGAIVSARLLDATPGFWGSETWVDHDLPSPTPTPGQIIRSLGAGGLSGPVDAVTPKTDPRLSCSGDDAVLAKL